MADNRDLLTVPASGLLAEPHNGKVVEPGGTMLPSTLRSLKVTPPQLPLKVVPRPRLWKSLDQAIERPITLISAGPGSGKTVLVNQWARTRTHRVVWVSLDPQDDGEDRLWHLVQYALQRQDLLSGIPEPDTGRSMVERTIDNLHEAAGRDDDLLLLILDDVHVLADADALSSLDAVLKHPPPRLRVVMTALSDPVLPLHRYRLQGTLSEIRAAELGMSISEVEQLLSAYEIRLAPPQIEMLAERTEGWVAGVRLSAMRMEGNPDPERFVTDFAMDRGSIGEYLMEEVLASQPSEVQRILVRSSICDPISGPLADAICETDSGTRALRDLAARNVFVTAVDHQGARYRYHPLLQEVLRHLLQREPTDVQRRGHLNAARWFDEEGSRVEALKHALLAKDWAICADLLARGAFEELYVRASAGPMGGIGRFVEADLSGTRSQDEQADLVAAQAAVAAAIGMSRATTLVANVRSTETTRGSAGLLADFAQFLVALGAERLDDVERTSSALVERDPVGPFGTFALDELGAVHLWQGVNHLAEANLQRALTQATALSLHATALRCSGRLAFLHSSTGRLSRAIELLDKGGVLLNEHPWIPAEFRVPYHLGAAQVAILQGDSDLYSRFLRLVETDLASKADPAVSSMAVLIKAKALQSAGRLPEAFELLSSIRPDTLGIWNVRGRADILRLELEAQLGRPKKAIRGLTSFISAHGDESATGGMLELGRAHLIAGKLPEAERLVRQIITATRPPDLLPLIETLLLHAEVADAKGEETVAVEAATRAAELASVERIVLPFVAATPGIRDLLIRHPALHDLWPAPMDDNSHRWAEELPATSAKAKNLAEPLTERERSILKWLTTTMTMAEIGTELYVSTNTVKTHVAAIYRKLEVSNRREAITRGRQLLLL